MLAPLFVAAVLATAPRLAPAKLDELVPYKQVFLTLAVDTLYNCDTASGYRKLTRGRMVLGPNGEAIGKSKADYDQLIADASPILWLTFLKTQGDSLYFVATVAKSAKENIYTSVCLEKNRIRAAYVEVKPEDKKEGKHEGHRGGGRRGGHGGGSDGGF